MTFRGWKSFQGPLSGNDIQNIREMQAKCAEGKAKEIPCVSNLTVIFLRFEFENRSSPVLFGYLNEDR